MCEPPKPIECRECGESFTPGRPGAVFCRPACRIAWSNRRNMRGALFYDMIMSQRFDRKNENEARSLLQNLARAARDADKVTRGGRRSWRDFEDAKRDVPLVFGQGGDGR